MILVTDFDNTLYSHSDPRVLMGNLQVAQNFRQAGNKFVLATGRNASSLGRVLPDFCDYFDYIILDNGAVCLNQSEEVVFQYVISEKTAQDISQDILQSFGGEIAFVYYHSAREWPMLDHNTTKLRCWTTDMEIGNGVLAMVNRNYGDQVKGFLVKDATLSSVKWIDEGERYHSFVDVMSNDAGKENAIRHLASSSPDETIITIGDDTNDIGMLTEFNGYAMRDSVQEVLEVVPSNHIVSSVAELIRLISN